MYNKILYKIFLKYDKIFIYFLIKRLFNKINKYIYIYTLKSGSPGLL